jgi:hypothetical protein
MTASRQRKLKELHDRLTRLHPYPWSSIEAWTAGATPLVREYFPVHFDDFLEVCKKPNWTMLPVVSSGGGIWDGRSHDNFAEVELAEEEANRRKAEEARHRIAGFLETLLGMLEETESTVPFDAEREVCQILERFPVVSRSLRQRSHSRLPLAITDEYDVQYVLGALLAVKFEDVRPEEWTPSHAAGSSRIDFLLKGERIVLEAKFARAGHADRQIADELMIDKERYATHPDCGTLICFVYDPDRVLRNPVALERDLASDASSRVIVMVRPR